MFVCVCVCVCENQDFEVRRFSYSRDLLEVHHTHLRKFSSTIQKQNWNTVYWNFSLRLLVLLAVYSQVFVTSTITFLVGYPPYRPSVAIDHFLIDLFELNWCMGCINIFFLY